MKPTNKPTSRLQAALLWLDDHILIGLVGSLIAFIPLYPKIPLADLLPGYIVRLRLDDLLIAFSALVWFIQVIRRKAKLNTPLTIMIGLYLLAGIASTLSAIFYTYTVPMSFIHIAKTLLHYFRRIEYFSLFFIAYSAVQTKQHVKKLLIVFCITAALVSAYGLGQKYLYWPVYSTMNREFSKGIRLYLTEHARVQSTFGGHYDYAAFLTIVLPSLVVIATVVRKRWIFIGLCMTFLISLWGMMMTSSRSSFIAYVAALTVILIFLGFKKGWLWWISRSFVLYTVTALFLVFFGDLLLRFGQIFQDNSAYLALQQSLEDAKKTVQAPVVDAPKDGVAIDDVDQIAKLPDVIDASDTRPTPVEELPPDVYTNVPAKIVNTRNARGENIQVAIPREFSDNAKRLGLSAAIRLDTTWPAAIRGYLRNPLFGSGYATLSKYTNDEFTEAESTDSDFLRTLGETGWFGFITFYGTMIIAIAYLWRMYRKTKDSWVYLFAVLLTAVTFGLMLNAVYIDVFVASKVIESYWMFVGILLAYAHLLPAATSQNLAAALASAGNKTTGKKKKDGKAAKRAA